MTDAQIRVILDTIPAETAWRRPDSVIRDTENWFQVITPSSKLIHLNGVYRSIIEPLEISATIDRTIEAFRKYESPFRWIVTGATRPVYLQDRLEKHKFKKDHVALGLVAETADISELAAPGVEVKALEVPFVEEWVDTLVTGWGHPESLRASLLADVLCALRDKDLTTRYFSAIIDGKIVGTGVLRLCAHSAHLLGSCVNPDFRGRGIYRALVAKRAEVGQATGLRLVTTHGMINSSAPILKQMGFRHYTEATQYSFDTRR